MTGIQKRLYLLKSKTLDSTVDNAKDFFEHIVKDHGFPDDIDTDKIYKYTFYFWKRLIRVKLS